MSLLLAADGSSTLSLAASAAVGLIAGGLLTLKFARRTPPVEPGFPPPAPDAPGTRLHPTKAPLDLNALLRMGSPVGLLLLAQDARILDANSTALDLLGRAINDAKTMDPGAFLAPADRAAFAARWSALSPKATAPGEFTVLRPDGSRAVVEILAFKLSDDRALAVLRDATADRAAAASLRLARRQLEAAFESLPSPLALLARDGTVLAVNRLWRERQLAPGWPAPAVRESDIVRPETHAALAAMLDPVAGLRPRDAAARWTLLAAPVHDPLIPIVIVEAAPALAPAAAPSDAPADQDHRSLAAILDSTAALIVVMAPDGRILTFNDACSRLTGFTPAEVVGKPFWKTVVPPEDREKLQAEFHRLISTGEPRPSENPWIGKDGRRHTILWSTALDRAPDGAIHRVVSTGIDVTDTRRMQNELVQAQRMEAIGQLAGGIAHDFNNLLTAIFGHTALAKRLIPADHEARPSLERVEQAAEQAGRVIRSLLTFSRTERSDKSPFSVAALVHDTASLIRGLLPASIELRTLPIPASLWVDADRLQIQQALLNLAINSRDAMPAGGVLRLSAAQVEGPAVAITVEDSGQGIPREILPRIFEPFFTTKPKSSGGGLGLPVAKSIAGDHGGSLAVTSEPGVGARATLTLPLRPAPAEPAACNPAGAARLLVASARTYPRRIMISALSALGPPVQGFSNSGQFLAELAAAPPRSAVAVCDTTIITEQASLLAVASEHKIPIIVLGDPAQLADLSAHGAAILAEPFTTAQLLQAVRRLIEANAADPHPNPNPAGHAYSR